MFPAPDQPSSRASVTTPTPTITTAAPTLVKRIIRARAKKALPRRGAARLLSFLPLQGSQSGRLANEIRGSRAYYLAECQVADVMIVVSLRLLHVKLRTNNRYCRRTSLPMRHRPRINVHRPRVSSAARPASRCTDVAGRQYNKLQAMARRASYSPKTVLHGRLSSEDRRSAVDRIRIRQSRHEITFVRCVIWS